MSAALKKTSWSGTPETLEDTPTLGAARKFAPEPSQDETAPERLIAEEPAPQDRRGPMRPVNLAPSRSRLTGAPLALGFRALDAIAIVTCAVIGLRQASPVPLVATPLSALPAFVLGAAALIWSLSAVRAYGFKPREGLFAHIGRTLVGLAVGWTATVLAGMVFFPAQDLEASSWLLAAMAITLAGHGIAWGFVRSLRKAGRLTANIVIVGAGKNAERVIDSALSTGDVAVLGVFDDRADRAPKTIRGVPVLGDTDALLNHKIMPYVDKVVIAVPQVAQSRVRELVERLGVLPNPLTLVIDADGPLEDVTSARLTDTPLAYLSGRPNDARRAAVKRMQDLVIASLGLVVAAPVMALTALAIRLDSPGPVFFRQKRHGFNNEEITVWKFRSMRVEASDAKAARQVSKDDDRVTKVGKFIRKTSLDELPQIFNVLTGEMSLVGPRPHAIGMKTGDVESARLVAEYAHRHRMKPGITGWAAIHGSRGPVDTPESVRRRVALDVEYIERQSFWLDLYIIAVTIPCLLGDSETVR